MTYDQWKTRSPDDDAPVCPDCGGWLYPDTQSNLVCENCSEEMEEDLAQTVFFRWEPL